MCDPLGCDKNYNVPQFIIVWNKEEIVVVKLKIWFCSCLKNLCCFRFIINLLLWNMFLSLCFVLVEMNYSCNWNCYRQCYQTRCHFRPKPQLQSNSNFAGLFPVRILSLKCCNISQRKHCFYLFIVCLSLNIGR
jgi:hypothetical protein